MNEMAMPEILSRVSVAAPRDEGVFTKSRREKS
jgi:hypothetical protein